MPNLIAIDYDGTGQHDLFERTSSSGSALPASPVVFLTVTANGSAGNCFRHRELCENGRDRPFKRQGVESREKTRAVAEGCYRCSDPNSVDTWYIWALRRELFFNI